MIQPGVWDAHQRNAARGSVTLCTSDFYNALGSSRGKETHAIYQVVIESDEGIFSLMEPLSE